MSVMQRYLSVTESLNASSTRPPGVASLTVDGFIEPTILNCALTALAMRYPVLRGQILRDDNGFLLRISEDEIPTLRTVDGSAEDVLLAEINAPLPIDRQVARTVLSRDGTSSTITLCADHSIADGYLIATFLYELLDNYTLLAARNTPRLTPTGDLFPSLDTMLTDRFSDEEIVTFIAETVAVAEQSSAIVLPSLASSARITPSVFSVRNISFTARTTTEILIVAKKNGLSAHSLISGAVVAALRAQLKPADEPITLAVACPVDLRRRLIPPVALNAQLCCVGRVSVYVSASHPADPRALGQQIMAQVRAAIENGDPEKWVLAMNHGDAIAIPPPSVVVSNLGRLATPPTPSEIQVVACRFLTAYPGPIPLIFVNTTGSRLTLDMVYDRSFLTDQQMSLLSDDIKRTLNSMQQ